LVAFWQQIAPFAPFLPAVPAIAPAFCANPRFDPIYLNSEMLIASRNIACAAHRRQELLALLDQLDGSLEKLGRAVEEQSQHNEAAVLLRTQGKRQTPSLLYVSLDNADTVIEGATLPLIPEIP
jgi:hypothetical protein